MLGSRSRGLSWETSQAAAAERFPHPDGMRSTCMVFLSGWGERPHPTPRGGGVLPPPLLGGCLCFLGISAAANETARPPVVGNGNASFVTPARPGFLSGQNAFCRRYAIVGAVSLVPRKCGQLELQCIKRTKAAEGERSTKPACPSTSLARHTPETALPLGHHREDPCGFSSLLPGVGGGASGSWRGGEHVPPEPREGPALPTPCWDLASRTGRPMSVLC